MILKKAGRKACTRWVLAACLFACLPLNAQRISVSHATIDCGKTGFESPVTATFELRNKGVRRLLIDSVKADCGCTKVEYPKGEIGVGDKFTISMTYDARQLGHFQKQVAVMSNGSKKPLYLTMKGVVLEDMKDYSGSYPYDLGGLLIDKNNLEFDDVNKGEHPQQEIHVMNNGSGVMTPNVLHLPPYLSAEVMPRQLMPGRSGKIVFTLNSEKLRDYGLTQTSVYMARQIGEKVQNENEVGVSAVLLPDFTSLHGVSAHMSLSATSMDLGSFEGKPKKTGEIVITNSGTTPLKISSLQMFTSGLKVTLGKRELQPGENTKLKVTAFRDDLKKARSKPRVLMITNDPNHSKIVININVE